MTTPHLISGRLYDGYTQPIVCWLFGTRDRVDGAVTGALDRTGEHSQSTHLGTPPSQVAGPTAWHDRLFWSLSGADVATLGQNGRAAAIDSTALWAKGGVWHKKDREAGRIPHSTIDTEAHWSKSGYHGWWYGWKLHLVSTAAALWIPLAANLTHANVADQDEAPALVGVLDPAIRYLLGDTYYNDLRLRQQWEQDEARLLIASRPSTHLRTDPDAKVRQFFHLLRSTAIKPFNGLFKNVFEWSGQVLVRRLHPTKLIVLGAVFVYQLVLFYQFEHGLPLGKQIKPLLRAA